MRRPVSTIALSLLLLISITASTAQAHIVLQGVGSQSWFKLSPRSLELTFNMGFSAILGFEYLQRIDSNHDGHIDDLETQLFLEDLGPKLAKKLDLKIDGKDLDLKLNRSWATGLIGDVARVEFDTFFVFRAELDLGTSAHKLTWYEGNFPKEKSQQFAWLPAISEDYQQFQAHQKMPLSAPQQERDWIRHEGRDLSLDFAFRPEALVRAEARAKAQEPLEALEKGLKAFETQVLRRELEDDLSLLAFEDARFGGASPLPATPGPSAAIAASREPGKEKVFEAPVNEQQELEELKWALDQINQPFSWLAILVFMAMGAWHARTPGHGKTMVAAYLIGRKGTISEAIKLGLMVTFTHTLSLYTMGLFAVYVVQRIYATEDYSANAFVAQATFWVKFGSGVLVFGFGLLLLSQRYAVWKAGGILPEPAPGDSEAPRPMQGESQEQASVPALYPDHGELSEEEHSALHANDYRDVHSFRDLLAVAISGGLVPCPMGILIIIYSLRPGSEANNVVRCLSYLVSFSVGLGGVITALALTMVLFRERFAKELEKRGRRGLINFAPVFGAAVITILGLALTYESFDANLKALRAQVLGKPPQSQGGSR